MAEQPSTPNSLEPLPFLEAIRKFADLVPMTRAEYEALAEEVRVRAFTVSRVASMQMIEAIRDEIAAALQEGLTFDAFKSRLATILAKNGWAAPDPWHTETVFRTNIQTAYGHGRMEQHHRMQTLYPYGRYIGILDSRIRPNHRKLHGQIYPMSHPFWRLHYPPWEYNCRCSVEMLSEEEFRESGQTAGTDMGPQPKGDFQGPGIGFSFGEPRNAVNQLMPRASAEGRQQVVNYLEDPVNIEASKKRNPLK